jgi:4-hydroxythreonine-4-phosphate dehydrogenase
MSKKRVAISIGDLNGIGIEIALKAHKQISKIVKPIYIIDKDMLKQASKLLNLKIPKDFKTISPEAKKFKIKPGKVSKKSGKYSFLSFLKAINLAQSKKVDAIVTLPINKEAWEKAKLSYVGHTDFLRLHLKEEAIMMLGCPKMYVALYTEHIPLKEVPKEIKTKKLTKFLLDLQNSIKSKSKIAVLGLNPHAGDNGVLGSEEKSITKAINLANKKLPTKLFVGPIVPDIAFTPNFRKNFKYFVALYHDQGLAPLKALYFDESINVSLNLSILRSSVDHGTAFDIAYKNGNPKIKSYINAVKYVAKAK